MRAKIHLHSLGRDTNGCSRYFPQGYLHSPTICHRLVAEDLMKWKQPISVKLLHYIDDVLLTSDPLMDLEQWAPELIKHLESCGWAVNTTKIPSLKGWNRRLWGILWVFNIKTPQRQSCPCGGFPAISQGQTVDWT